MVSFPFKSLRDWMKFLREKGELVLNKTEVDLATDISAIAHVACRTKAAAVLHERIKGYPGWRILAGTFNTLDRMAYALGVNRETMLREIAGKLDTHVAPMEVSTGPCKEVRRLGNDVDLTKLPMPFTGECEGTPNITAGVSNKRDPETGWQNIAVRRFGLKGPRRLSEFINPTQQDFMIWGKYRRAKTKMPIAIVIGVDPCTYLASQVKAPVGFCEYDLVGAFTGAPLEVVRCETSDLLVPADAEIVIEGEIDPYVRELDGPFPEMVGYYTTIASVARVDVTAVTMREDAIYYYLNMGMKPTEGHAIGELMFAITFYRELTKHLPGILDVRAINWNAVAVKVDKRIAKAWPQYAAAVGNILKFVASPALKLVIVVDDDCEDLEDQDCLFNAIWSKFQASRDLTIIPRTTGTALDPSEPWCGRWGWTDFMIMDCTEPPAPYDEGYRRGKAVPAAEALAKVREKWSMFGF